MNLAFDNVSHSSLISFRKFKVDFSFLFSRVCSRNMIYLDDVNDMDLTLLRYKSSLTPIPPEKKNDIRVVFILVFENLRRRQNFTLQNVEKCVAMRHQPFQAHGRRRLVRCKMLRFASCKERMLLVVYDAFAHYAVLFSFEFR